jgi:hypothetical protein
MEDIRAGMDDYALMIKFHLSARGLQSLLSKLVSAGAIAQSELDKRMPDTLGAALLSRDEEHTEKPPVNSPENNAGKAPAAPSIQIREILTDIRAGMTDGSLMDKYRLSAKGLQNVLDQLIDAGVIGPSELDQRMLTFDTTVDVREMMKQFQPEERPFSGDAASKVPEKCPACGAPQTILFDDCPMCGVNIAQYRKKQEMDRKTAAAPWKCPACGRPWTRQFDECPVCGVIVSKL